MLLGNLHIPYIHIHRKSMKTGFFKCCIPLLYGPAITKYFLIVPRTDLGNFQINKTAAILRRSFNQLKLIRRKSTVRNIPIRSLFFVAVSLIKILLPLFRDNLILISCVTPRTVKSRRIVPSSLSRRINSSSLLVRKDFPTEAK